MDSIQERESRIEELKKKKAELLSNGNKESTKESEGPTIRFRNYIPKDETLKEKMETVVAKESILDFESDLKASMEMPGRNETINLAPKKPNWDLKRGIQHKLDKLEKETQKAMIRMLKEKIEEEGSEESEEEVE